MKIYVVTQLDETWDGENENYVDILSGDAYYTMAEAQEVAAELWGGDVREVELHDRAN